MNIINELKDEYIQLINKGYTTKQIANHLGKSASTIKRHFQKMGLKTIHKKEPYNINEHELKSFIEKKYSTYQIANELNCSQTTIRYWLKKYNLTINSAWSLKIQEIQTEINNGYKTCSKCKIKKNLTKENFYIKKTGKFHAWCKECNDKNTYLKQFNRKKQCVDYKGGKCKLCGYNKYIGALDFHHVNPSTKEFSISTLRTYSWDKLKKELDKCICVCKNCHAEIHFGIHSIHNSIHFNT